MKVSYDGPPDFNSESIQLKIELHPSEVAAVVGRLLGTKLSHDRVLIEQFGGVPLSAFTDGQLESIQRAVSIEQTARAAR